MLSSDDYCCRPSNNSKWYLCWTDNAVDRLGLQPLLYACSVIGCEIGNITILFEVNILVKKESLRLVDHPFTPFTNSGVCQVVIGKFPLILYMIIHDYKCVWLFSARILITLINYKTKIGNDPKFSNRHAWANSADPDQTAPQGLHCLPFRLHRLDSLLYGRAT